MLKFLKWIGLGLVGLIMVLAIAGWWIHEPLPEGKPGPEADKLAREMMASVHVEAWDSTRWLSWNFMGLHDFVWNKERHLVEVRWGDYRVLLDPDTATGKAWQDGQELSGKEAEQAVRSALAYFFNDAFWLNPVVKAFDPGTKRSIVELEDGGEGLMVTYTSGGVTPGDSYLWILDEHKRPKAWKMWVSVLPIGGISNTWSSWDTLSTGALVATARKAAIGGVNISQIKGGMQLEDIGRKEDPFVHMED